MVKIIDTMTTNDKQQFFYLVEYNNKGKKAHKWMLASEMTEDLKTKETCFCLTYTIYNVYDYFLGEKRNMTRGGTIFESVADFEQWRKNLKNYCEFSKMEILG